MKWEFDGWFAENGYIDEGTWWCIFPTEDECAKWLKAGTRSYHHLDADAVEWPFEDGKHYRVTIEEVSK